MTQFDHWEPVIGLEIHSQLNTKSKLFSHAPNRFGDEPNVNITEVCTGMPGSLPVINKEAVRKAVQFGCAIKAEIPQFSKFDRKSYFYPDSPRNFQITQYDQPIVIGGTVTAEVNGKEMQFAVNRVHLEDDAGMLKHFSNFAGVDYNRAGVPLIEIVSEPCIHSPDEAVAYATAIRAILQYLDVSDCNMEEGSLRFDVNISVRKKGETALRPKIEIKNLNSFSNMHRAVTAEIKRQIKLYTDHPDLTPTQLIPQSTYRFDPDLGEVILMRRKEDADDYRYFPEPDLPPLILTQEFIDQIRSELPELPLERERRYVKELGLSLDHAFFLTSDKQSADYFETAYAIHPNAKALCNWIIIEFAGRYKESGMQLSKSGITPENLAHLVKLVDEEVITGRMAKSIADLMVENPGKDPREIVKENPDFQPLSDSSEIEAMIDQVINQNHQSVIDFKNGKQKAFSFLVGQVMKLSRGKASPPVVNKLLIEKIEKVEQ
ncbi:MAG: Asp-tRNA(Asn)/Glu-tRNA(Gln) amidotransferase subunit GatB [Waddliaceae bacterium]